MIHSLPTYSWAVEGEANVGRDRLTQGPLAESGRKFWSAPCRFFLSSNSHLNARRIHQLEQEKSLPPPMALLLIKDPLPWHASSLASTLRRSFSTSTSALPPSDDASPTPRTALLNSWPGPARLLPNASSSSRPALTRWPPSGPCSPTASPPSLSTPARSVTSPRP